MEELKLPHRIVLVNYLGRQRQPVKSPEMLEKWVSLAVVFEAMMLKKIAFKGTQLIINNPDKTGHSMIDDTVTFLKDINDKSNPEKWLSGFVSNSNAYHHVLDNLKENKLLESKRSSFLGIKGKEKTVIASEKIAQIVKSFIAQISVDPKRTFRDELTLQIILASGLADIDVSKIAQRKQVDGEAAEFFNQAIKILKE
ncbi:MAG TPA: GPP34 family phosphoprotein [Bacteroidales bacterium]|nr:GPP34 family phosphoprotein [Bacteroidales bacterium]